MNLKQKAVSGMKWNGVERFSSSLFLFISNLVLARLLSPEDFGAIGMLMVFIALSQAIVDGGFGAALIQKKEPTQTDYSTIFFWNIFLSIFLYIVLYFSAPAIADFYDMPSLMELLRVLGLILIFNALFLIQNNIFKKSINFKKIAKINLFAIVIGTLLGIVAAYYGYGVWSLVIKTISTSIIQCCIFWIYGKWQPTLVFCWSSFKSLFKFGGFVFINGLINTAFLNIILLIIGKKFTSTTLGYYTQGQKLIEIPRGAISAVLSNVLFPILSSIQDDKERVRSIVQKQTRIILFINVPLMFFLFLVAKPLILFLYTDKWASSIPYFQMLCVCGIPLTLREFNGIVLNSIGNSKLNFTIGIVYETMVVAFILVGMQWGMMGLLTSYAIVQYINLIISNRAVALNINSSLLSQFKDMVQILIFSFIAFGLSYLVSLLLIEVNNLLQCIIIFLVFFLSYLGLSYIFRLDEMMLFTELVKSKFRIKL